MANGPWTDEENNLVVADYFAMLAHECAKRDYNKSEHIRKLMPYLPERTDKSIELKHRNVSAVLDQLGLIWIDGFKPAKNYQLALVDAVEHWLTFKTAKLDWLEPILNSQLTAGKTDSLEIPVWQPPTMSNQSPKKQIEKMLGFARKIDRAGQDERNRKLGREVEKCVLAHERALLKRKGRDDLAERVRWVSELDGDGPGYDIESFTPNERKRLIEVKTTNGGERTPFHITRNELVVAEQKPEWLLFRIWDFSIEPKAFELRHPLEAHVSLIATNFQANIR